MPLRGLPPPVPQAGAGWLSMLAGAALIVAILYFAREVLIPLALALLLTFLLAPAVIRLRRWGLGRLPAVIVTTALAFSLIGLVGYVVAGQLMQLASDLPSYQQNISKKLRSLQVPGGGLFERTTQVFEELETEMAEAAEQAEGEEEARRPARRRTAEPMPVVVEPPASTPLESIAAFVSPLINPLATAGVVVVLVIFMLIQREDLRDRFIGLVGTGRLNLTTQALDDAGTRISRYLLMQLLVNVTYGLPVGIGLYFIGVPNALLWGVLATVLRFVPYLGPLLGMALPLLLAFAVDPGWNMLLMAAGLFLGLELVSNNIVEPWLYGSSTGISSVAIMVAAIFWTWLWGPIGLLLSTPLTVCIAVAGRYVPQLSFLSVLLGSEPALEPHVRLYQRMLALDFEEASEVAGELLESRPLRQVYDELLVPALSLAETDRHEGRLDEERKRFILDNTRDLAGELSELARTRGEAQGGEAQAAPAAPVRKAPIVCIPAQDESDEIGAIMLRELLRHERGLLVDLRPAAADLDATIAAIRHLGPEIVVVSSVPPAAVRHAVHTSKRLKSEVPDVRVVVGLWSTEADAARLRARLPEALAERLFTRLADAADWLGAELRAEPATAGMVAPPVPANEPARLEALARTGLLDTPAEDAFDRITRRLSEIFDAPISLMSLIDEKRQFWKSQHGLPEALAESRAGSRETSICGHVVAANESVVVEDTWEDARFAGNPFLREHNIRFYAGAPLRTADGSAIGSLCVIDHRPRQLSERERQLLELMADAVMAEVQRRTREAAEGGARTGPAGVEADTGQAGAVQALLAPPARQSIGRAVITHRWSGDGLPAAFVVTRTRADGDVVLLLGDAGAERASGPLMAAAISSAAGRLLDGPGSAGELLTALSRIIGAPESGVPVSAAAAVLAPEIGQFEVATAGYTPPILIRQHAAEAIATTVQPPLFGDAEWTYTAGASLRLEPGDRVLFYTERAADVPGPDESLIGVEGLAALALEHDQDDADALLASLDRRLSELAGGRTGWSLLVLDFARGPAATGAAPDAENTAVEAGTGAPAARAAPVYPAAPSR
jgi:predicted PurR-regulated permease PerM/GAF domain-containing protein